MVSDYSGLWKINLSQDTCLNPCFSGIWSLIAAERWAATEAGESLNPCFSGIWSLIYVSEYLSEQDMMRLNPCFSGIWSLIF